MKSIEGAGDGPEATVRTGAGSGTSPPALPSENRAAPGARGKPPPLPQGRKGRESPAILDDAARAGGPTGKKVPTPKPLARFPVRHDPGRLPPLAVTLPADVRALAEKYSGLAGQGNLGALGGGQGDDDELLAEYMIVRGFIDEEDPEVAPVNMTLLLAGVRAEGDGVEEYWEEKGAPVIPDNPALVAGFEMITRPVEDEDHIEGFPLPEWLVPDGELAWRLPKLPIHLPDTVDWAVAGFKKVEEQDPFLDDWLEFGEAVLEERERTGGAGPNEVRHTEQATHMNRRGKVAKDRALLSMWVACTCLTVVAIGIGAYLMHRRSYRCPRFFSTVPSLNLASVLLWLAAPSIHALSAPIGGRFLACLRLHNPFSSLSGTPAGLATLSLGAFILVLSILDLSVAAGEGQGLFARLECPSLHAFNCATAVLAVYLVVLVHVGSLALLPRESEDPELRGLGV